MEKKYLEIVDLPQVPQKFVDEIVSVFNIIKKRFVHRQAASEYVNDPNPIGSYCYNQREDVLNSLKINNLNENDIALFFDYINPLPRNLEEWIKENIMHDGITKIFILGFGEKFLPHTDRRTGEAFNYVLIKGGNVKNKFWKPNKEYENIPIPQNVYVPYEKIHCVAQYEIPEFTWHKFDPSEIHSVEDINSDEFRVIISVDNQYEKPYKKKNNS